MNIKEEPNDTTEPEQESKPEPVLSNGGGAIGEATVPEKRREEPATATITARIPSPR